MKLPLRILRSTALLPVSVVAAAAVAHFAWLKPERQRACALSCQSNLKSIKLAVHMYAQDYDGLLPPADNYFELYLLIYPYMKNMSMSFCPIGFNAGPRRFCYGWNHQLAGRSVDSLGDLATEPMLFDREPWHGGKRDAVAFGANRSRPISLYRCGRCRRRSCVRTRTQVTV